MAKTIKLNVPLVRQDRTMECWYASACMVCYYHVAGPRYGVPKAWQENKGLPFPDFSTLAKSEHMVPLRFDRNHQWTQDELAQILSTRGPIWAWGIWYGASHIVVITGVDQGNVFLNDPSGPARKSMSLADFNARVVRSYPPNAAPLMVYSRTS